MYPFDQSHFDSVKAELNSKLRAQCFCNKNSLVSLLNRCSPNIVFTTTLPPDHIVNTILSMIEYKGLKQGNKYYLTDKVYYRI